LVSNTNQPDIYPSLRLVSNIDNSFEISAVNKLTVWIYPIFYLALKIYDSAGERLFRFHPDNGHFFHKTLAQLVMI
jgi:hypothetical protein